MFPISLRSITGAFGAATQWLSSFAATMSAPHMQAAVGGYVFIFYGLCCFATLVFTFCFVPETKGVPIETVGKLFGTSHDGDNELTPQVERRGTASGVKRRSGRPTVSLPLSSRRTPPQDRRTLARRRSSTTRSAYRRCEGLEWVGKVEALLRWSSL